MIRGHRRISNELMRRHPAEGPWSPRDFFLEFDAVAASPLTLSAWSRASGRSRRWVRARISEYLEAESELRKAGGQLRDSLGTVEGQADSNKSNGLPAPADRLGTVEGQLRDTPLSSYKKQDTRNKRVLVVTPTPEPPARRKETPQPPPENLTVEQMVTLRGWCDRTFPDQLPRLEHHVGACLDHFRSKGVSRADWPATARNWIRRSDEWQKERNADRKDFDPKHSVIDASASLLEEWKKRGLA